MYESYDTGDIFLVYHDVYTLPNLVNIDDRGQPVHAKRIDMYRPTYYAGVDIIALLTFKLSLAYNHNFNKLFIITNWSLKLNLPKF